MQGRGGNEMSLFDAFSISSSGLEAERVRMKAIANNIANINTTRQDGEVDPYKRKEVIFEEVLQGKSGNKGVKVAEIMEDDTPHKVVYKPNHPDADENGYVKMPNVDLHFEMVDLVSASRSYQANLVAMKLLRTMVEQTMNLG